MRKITVFAMITFLTMLLVLAGCSREDGEDVEVSLDEPQAVEEVPEVAPEAPVEAPVETTPPTTDSLPSTTEQASEPTTQPASEPAPATVSTAGSGDVEIINQRTKRGRVLERSFEEASFFSNIQCRADSISFTFKNNDEHDYHLTKVDFEEQAEKEAVSLRVNNKDVRGNPMEVCKTEVIKAQEEITCNVKGLVRRGVSPWGKQLVNELEATSLYYNSKVVFKCPDGEEAVGAEGTSEAP